MSQLLEKFWRALVTWWEYWSNYTMRLISDWWQNVVDAIAPPVIFDTAFWGDLPYAGPYIALADQIVPLTTCIQAGIAYMVYKLSLMTARLIYRGAHLIWS